MFLSMLIYAYKSTEVTKVSTFAEKEAARVAFAHKFVWHILLFFAALVFLGAIVAFLSLSAQKAAKINNTQRSPVSTSSNQANSPSR